MTLFLLSLPWIFLWIFAPRIAAVPPPFCPSYGATANERQQENLSKGRYQLPFKRPERRCRLYRSEEVEEAIERLRGKIKDPDLFRLFENSFPNTLDTMVKWKGFAWKNETAQDDGGFTDEDLAFVITGDM